MVVYGQDGLDEISVSAPTTVCEVRDGSYSSYILRPEQFGMEQCLKSELVGGTPAENAGIAREILDGRKGAKRNAVVLNSAAALHITKGISMEKAVAQVQELLDSGKAKRQLEAFVTMSNQI